MLPIVLAVLLCLAVWLVPNFLFRIAPFTKRPEGPRDSSESPERPESRTGDQDDPL